MLAETASSAAAASPTGLVIISNGEHAIHSGTHLERPERVIAIQKHLSELGLSARCQRIFGREATLDELSAVHSEAHIARMQDIVEPMLLHDDSMYINANSYECAQMAAGGVLELVERVVAGDIANGFAVVRPPGHHVEVDDLAGGFGVFNSVAIAALSARRNLGIKRVLIVDWDVHHGNGTQHIFEDDPTVLYFSVHRYDNGDFFPCSRDAAPEVVGCGRGQGFNMNVAWNVAWKDQQGMGDDEYFAAWEHVLLPVVKEFQPELVLVSAGFDAARGDIGGCSVSPAGFARLTRMLQNSCPKLILVLEGGYKLEVISECVSGCLSALLGDPVALCTHAQPKKEARLSIERTLRAHRPFWACLCKNARLDVMSPQAILMTNHASDPQCEEPLVSFTGDLHDNVHVTDLPHTSGHRKRCQKNQTCHWHKCGHKKCSYK
jgi:histone deacetylase 6